MHKRNAGFTTVEIILVLFVLTIIGITGYFVSSKRGKPASVTVATSAAQSKTTVTASPSAKSTVTATSPTPTPTTTPVKISPTPTTTAPPTFTSPPTLSSNASNPTVTITSPFNGQVFTSSVYELTCTFTTSTGKGDVTMSVKDSHGVQVEGSTQKDITPDNCYSKSENTYNAYPNGSYTITITVVDPNGKTATATNSFSWKL